MATVTNYPIDLPILVIEAQIFVAVKKFPFLPNKQIPNTGGLMLMVSPEAIRLKHSSILGFEGSK